MSVPRFKSIRHAPRCLGRRPERVVSFVPRVAIYSGRRCLRLVDLASLLAATVHLCLKKTPTYPESQLGNIVAAGQLDGAVDGERHDFAVVLERCVVKKAASDLTDRGQKQLHLFPRPQAHHRLTKQLRASSVRRRQSAGPHSRLSILMMHLRQVQIAYLPGRNSSFRHCQTFAVFAGAQVRETAQIRLHLPTSQIWPNTATWIPRQAGRVSLGCCQQTLKQGIRGWEEW